MIIIIIIIITHASWSILFTTIIIYNIKRIPKLLVHVYHKHNLSCINNFKVTEVNGRFLIEVLVNR